MKSLLCVALFCLLSIQSSEAWWGLGGLGWGGLGWGGLGWGGLGWGRPLGFGGLGWGLGGLGNPYAFYGKRNIQMPTEKVECYYISGKQMITCNGGAIECQTTSYLDGLGINFDMFGIGLDNGVLNLYAKNFTEPNFVSRIPTKDGNLVGLSIFQGGVQGNGLMINDGVCYNKILGLFNGIKTPVMVDTIGTGNVKSTVGISGFLLDL
jgi:hypothetical protein